MTKPKKPKPRKTRAARLGAIPEEVSVIPADQHQTDAAPGPDDQWPDDPAVTGGVDSPSNYALSSPKQEKFAQLIAKGIPLHEAYLEAGYRGSPGNARRLRSDEAIWERIKALQAEIGRQVVKDAAAEIKALGYTREDAFREAGEARKLALALGQSGAAVAATKLRAEIAGIPMGETTGDQDTRNSEQEAREKADPRVALALERVGSGSVVRGLVLAGGKDVEAKKGQK